MSEVVFSKQDPSWKNPAYSEWKKGCSFFKLGMFNIKEVSLFNGCMIVLVYDALSVRVFWRIVNISNCGLYI